ncbi:MAG: hypothetical protein DWI48_00420 [Chloroflexi bacterium]|nr:MAG: hypothetical protein DWI48_00420 [Chloroflexota bacterium]
MTSSAPLSIEELTARFNNRLAEQFQNARNFVPFLSVRNLPALGPDEGLPLARHTLISLPSQAFQELWAGGALSFTVEWLVTQDQYRRLFTPAELDIARVRIGLEPLQAPAETTRGELEARFTASLIRLCDFARDDMRYEPVRFRALLDERGGVEAVRAVLAEPALLGALAEIAEAGRSDLSVEARAASLEFGELFSVEELATARARAPH